MVQKLVMQEWVMNIDFDKWETQKEKSRAYLEHEKPFSEQLSRYKFWWVGFFVADNRCNIETNGESLMHLSISS